MSISNYFIKMEGIADAFFLVNHEVSEKELVMAILIGLPVDYNVIVPLVSNKLSNTNLDLSDQELVGLVISVQEFQAMAMSQETHIEQHNSSSSFEAHNSMANLTKNYGNRERYRGKNG